MPNPRKQNEVVALDMNMKALARVHYFYVKGVESAQVLTEEQCKLHYDFIEEMERILVGSGYLTEKEIKERHTKKPEVVSDSSLVKPFSLLH